MFEVHAHTAHLCAVNDVRRHFARKYGIFAVILEISAVERRAVQVHAGSVYRADTRVHALVAERATEIEREIGVPRLTENDFVAESRPFARLIAERAVYVYVESARAVDLRHRGLTHARSGVRAVSAGLDEIEQFALGKLRKQAFPTRFVVVRAERFHKLRVIHQTAARFERALRRLVPATVESERKVAFHSLFGHLRNARVRVALHIVVRLFDYLFDVAYGRDFFGERPHEIRAAHVLNGKSRRTAVYGNVRIRATLDIVTVRVEHSESVLHHCAGIGVALILNGVFGGKADGVFRAFAESLPAVRVIKEHYLILALFEHESRSAVTVRVVCVIRRKIV